MYGEDAVDWLYSDYKERFCIPGTIGCSATAIECQYSWIENVVVLLDMSWLGRSSSR